MAPFSVLMVAEKPSICTSVAEALNKLCGNREKLVSRNRSPPVYEFEGNFLGKAATIKVTSVTGHVFSLDFPTEFQNWDATDPMDLFTAPTKKVSDKGGIHKHLEREARGADALVLWMDCDREGENICFEVISCVKNAMKPSNGRNIYRAKFSAVTTKDIEKAMQNLVEPNENESKSVDARQELDLKVGVAFSRFQTRYFQGKYGNLDSAVISYGPCQTPTLGFCVQRHDDIQSFVPEPFWYLDVQLEVGGKKASLKWDQGKLFDHGMVETLESVLSSNRELLCQDVKSSETRKIRPQPLNTVEMLKLASKHLGIGPHATMRAAEHLYLSGLISYPRTESTAYPKSFDIREVLQVQKDHPDWGYYSKRLLQSGYCNPRQGHDAGDHPPITPVGLATDLSGDNWRIYDLVTRHFLATISNDATYLQTRAKFSSSVSSETFRITSKRELHPGYLEIYRQTVSSREERDAEREAGAEGEDEDYEDDDDLDTQNLAQEFVKGQKYAISQLKINQGSTSAPGYLTEAELIGIMEKHGIGTDASIPTHINNIMTRNYVTLGQGRTLIPTELGIVLVHGYLRIDPGLVLPDVRAAIESFCNLIAKGVASKDHVVQHSLSNFMKKFDHFRKNIGAMDSLFQASFDPLAASGKPLGKCGKCLRYMKLISLKPQRLYCPTCEETYSLPQNGTIKLYKELKCPLDNFDLVLFSLGNTEKAQGKSYPLCPYCYNHPPSFEDVEDLMKKQSTEGENQGELDTQAQGDSNEAEEDGEDGEDDDEEEDKFVPSHMGCNSCLHPSCKHSLVQNGVCQCPGNANNANAACSGMLVLDVNSKPNWKLGCNQCNTLIRFKAEIHSITPQPRKECKECGIKLLNFEFNKLKSPLPGGETNFVGCIVCDDFLNSIAEVVAGRTINLTVLRQMKHRRNAAARGKKGRGFKGRGGRGGGRRNKTNVLMSFEDF